MVAIKVEREAALAHFSPTRQKFIDETAFELAWWYDGQQEWEIIIVQTNQGNRVPGLLLERARWAFRPEVAFFTGIAGGLKDDVQLGDIVFGTNAVGFALGKETDDSFLQRAVNYHSDQGLAGIAQQLQHDDCWRNWRRQQSSSDAKVEIGCVASGDNVLASNNGPLRQRIKDGFSAALCVEMEGLSFVESLPHMPKMMRGGLIRAISDMVGDKTETDAAGFQIVAADNAIAFNLEMLARYGRLASESNYPFYGTILFDGRENIETAQIRGKGWFLYSSNGEKSGASGDGRHFFENNNAINIVRTSLEGRYELHLSFKLTPQSEWSEVLPQHPDGRAHRFIRVTAECKAEKCSRYLRIVLADEDKGWFVAADYIKEIFINQWQLLDVTLIVPADGKWRLRLDDERVSINDATLTLRNLVVIEEEFRPNVS
jgi:nucleoside phosphorylase